MLSVCCLLNELYRNDNIINVSVITTHSNGIIRYDLNKKKRRFGPDLVPGNGLNL